MVLQLSSIRKKRIKARFKTDFSAAFFELFLHELFLKEGYTLIPHPEVSGTAKRPDFLIKGNGIEFYLEAKEATDKSDSERSVANLHGQLYDQLNETKSPNFFLQIKDIEFKSNKAPSGRKIRRYLENELVKFDPDIIEAKLKTQGLNSVDTINFEDESVKLEIALIPKSPKNRGKKGVRPIGMYPFYSLWGGSDDSIKSAIEKKATRYGVPSRPYVICINATSERGLDQQDVIQALFGTHRITTEDKAVRLTGNRDGAFLNSSGPRFTRVSAVFVTRVWPVNVHTADHWFVKIPFAKNKLPSEPFTIKLAEIVNEQLEINNGRSIQEVLGLPDDWLNV